MKRWQTALLVLIFFAGLSLLVYPSFSDYWNSLRQSRLVAEYMGNVSSLAEKQKQVFFEDAAAYNEELAQLPMHFNLTPEEQVRYENTLDVSGTGVMGYLEVPKINVSLPIYHNTDKAILEFAIGHLAGTSLPVGGPSTHAVLTGHTGLPSARLLTDLEELELGDVFYVQVMTETLTYEVDQIRTVLPEVTKDLAIVPGEDYCTLVTCTPYGVNTHRLLVRGHRIETAKEATLRYAADAIMIDPLIVVPCLAAPLLLIIFILVMIQPNWGKKRKETVREILSRH